MLGLPSKEIKQAADAFKVRMDQIESVIQNLDTTVTNLALITEDVRAITKALREALVKEQP